MDLHEARRKLELCFGEELRKEYFSLLEKRHRFEPLLTKDEYEREVYKLLKTEEQIRCHICYSIALATYESSHHIKTMRISCERNTLEQADFVDYVQDSNPKLLNQGVRIAASELFLPDAAFIDSRIILVLREHNLEAPANNVTDLMVHACQVFVKNIVAAMVQRVKPYKVRDGKFPYGFNLPIPSSLVKNSQNIIDNLEDPKIEDGELHLKNQPLFEMAEQQAAFVYACSKKRRCGSILTVKLLYETLRDNPHLLASHDLHNMSLLKLSATIGD